MATTKSASDKIEELRTLRAKDKETIAAQEATLHNLNEKLTSHIDHAVNLAEKLATAEEKITELKSILRAKELNNAYKDGYIQRVAEDDSATEAAAIKPAPRETVEPVPPPRARRDPSQGGPAFIEPYWDETDAKRDDLPRGRPAFGRDGSVARYMGDRTNASNGVPLWKGKHWSEW